MQKYIHKTSGEIIQAAQATKGESHGHLDQLPEKHWKIYNEDGSPQHLALSEEAFNADYKPYNLKAPKESKSKSE